MIFRSYVSLSEGNLLNLRLTYDLHGKYLKSCPTRVVTILGWPHYKPPTKSAFRNYTGETKTLALPAPCFLFGEWSMKWRVTNLTIWASDDISRAGCRNMLCTSNSLWYPWQCRTWQCRTLLRLPLKWWLFSRNIYIYKDNEPVNKGISFFLPPPLSL